MEYTYCIRIRLIKSGGIKMSNAIEINNLVKSYKGFTLHIPQMNIPKGCATALIG